MQCMPQARKGTMTDQGKRELTNHSTTVDPFLFSGGTVVVPSTFFTTSHFVHIIIHRVGNSRP